MLTEQRIHFKTSCSHQEKYAGILRFNISWWSGNVGLQMLFRPPKYVLIWRLGIIPSWLMEQFPAFISRSWNQSHHLCDLDRF